MCYNLGEPFGGSFLLCVGFPLVRVVCGAGEGVFLFAGRQAVS